MWENRERCYWWSGKQWTQLPNKALLFGAAEGGRATAEVYLANRQKECQISLAEGHRSEDITMFDAAQVVPYDPRS